MKTLTLAAAICASAIPSFAEPIAGYDRLTIETDHRTDVVAGSVWYPVGIPTYVSQIGEDAVFQGQPAYMGAAIAEGTYPLIVLSHGSGGNMDALGWLSSELALKGAIVLAVNHQGSTSRDSSPRRSIRMWDRTDDLSAALDYLLSDPSFASRVDMDHISAIGFSMGGATALNLGGVQMSGAAFQDYCAEYGDRAVECAFFAKGGVDLSALPVKFDQSMKDHRVGRVVAIDPGFGHIFTDETVAAMSDPVLLFNLGDGATRFSAVDVGPNGSNLSGRLPNVEYIEIAPATHFTFLAECSEIAPMILADEGEDPICTDPEGTDRAAVHSQIIADIARFLEL